MKTSKSKVVIVMPAYNAAKTLKETVNEIPKGIADDIILVDDFSQDNTVKMAHSLGLFVVTHSQNKGYGANQKTCYKLAIKRGGDIIVLLHPDYQYDARLIEKIIQPIREKQFDVMLGSRIRAIDEAIKGGMPAYKYIGNRFLTFLGNIILGQNLSEFHSGFRAFHKDVLNKLEVKNFSDDFIFDQEFLIKAISSGYKIGEIPVPVRYYPFSSSINFPQACKYAFLTIFLLIKYVLSLTKMK